MQERLEKAVGKALGKVFPDVEYSGVLVDVSDNFGDFTTNAAMVLAKQVGKSPQDVAEELIKNIEKQKVKFVKRIEVAGPGFINFFVSDKFFVESVSKTLKEGHGIGKNNLFKGKNILIEYTDPNPFKVFHIGHLMPNVIGESFSRLYEFGGAKVKRANYQGDVGLHVAKSMWSLSKPSTEDFKKIEDKPLEERVAVLGRAYVDGNAMYEEDGVAREEIKEINRWIYESSGNDEFKERYDKGRQWSLDHFETLYRILGTRFDYYFFESQTFSEGAQTVLNYVEKGVFEKSDGAIIFPGSKYDLHDRVFINSEGLPTYEAKDLGLVMLKNKTCGSSDKFVVVTGNEQSEYFKVIIKAVEQIDSKLAQKMEHIGHGMLRLTSGKMSSRKGNVVTGESLLKDTIKRANEKIVLEDVGDAERKLIAQAVGVSAIKFSILRNNIGKDIIYDPEKALSFEGDSGPYVQYTNVRAQSIVRKAYGKGIKSSTKGYNGPVGEVEKILQRFPAVLERAGRDMAPHVVCTYLLELSSAFNSFYANTPILGGGDVAAYRVALSRAVSQALKNGLYVLGINAPERM